MSRVNPAITSKIEAMDVSCAVQQFLKDLLAVEADSEGGKNDSYNAVIEEYAKNPEIESWVQKSGV